MTKTKIIRTIPGNEYVIKDKQCTKCTHYKKEHIESLEGHCNHTIESYEYEDTPPGGVLPRQVCSCRSFQE